MKTRDLKFQKGTEEEWGKVGERKGNILRGSNPLPNRRISKKDSVGSDILKKETLVEEIFWQGAKVLQERGSGTGSKTGDCYRI